jgi:phospholipid/cholesterol/gamma-HCH transport system substrate-binding protein
MTRGRELLVGVVIIAALSVAVVGTLFLQGTNFGRPQVEVDVLLRNVAQLGPGNAVKYLGVRIGRVSQIAVEGSAVRVSMLLSEEIDLPEDAVVLLGPESMFGAWQAEIVSRSDFPRYPFYEVPPDAGPGVVLGGYALPELSRLTASAEQISTNLGQLTDRLEIAFNQETADNLARAITNIEAITREVRELVDQQSAVATSVTANADSALAEIELASRAARRSFEHLEGILSDDQLDSIVTNVRIASAGIQKIATDLSGSTGDFQHAVERADSTFARLDRISARVEAGEGTFGRLLADSTLAVRAEDVLAQLDLLLEDLRKNPRRYVRLSIF